jgi:hypothetical protein
MESAKRAPIIATQKQDLNQSVKPKLLWFQNPYDGHDKLSGQDWVKMLKRQGSRAS